MSESAEFTGVLLSIVAFLGVSFFTVYVQVQLLFLLRFSWLPLPIGGGVATLDFVHDVRRKYSIILRQLWKYWWYRVPSTMY